MKTWPTLYKKTSTGAIQTWSISVKGSEIVIKHGQLDGKIQETSDIVSEGKNTGKANETSATEQAEAEAQAKWEKQIKKGYVEALDRAEAGEKDVAGGIDPMLAHKFRDHGHKVKWPQLISPKLDGHRVIAIVKDGKCTLWSRTRKPVNSIPHIARYIETHFANGTILDGEAYANKFSSNFEALTSIMRQDEPKLGKAHEAIQYHVFDMVADAPFSARYAVLETAFKTLKNSPLALVPQTLAHSEEEMRELFSEYMAAGYEGAMVKDPNSKYEFKRSRSLLKVKDMQDAEFPIIGVEEGRGAMAGKAIFVCQAKGGEFRCKMEGPLDDLAKYLTNEKLWKGKLLTVRFQDYTSDNKPRFPVGARIRDDI